MLSQLVLTLGVLSQVLAAPKKPTIGDGDHPYLPPPRRSFFDINPIESTKGNWIANAQATVHQIINRRVNRNVAKNVILFLGDGMSIPTVAAARVYMGGEEAQLSFDRFPYTALSKTYAVDRQVADSANTATAYLCGVKANYGTMGIGPEVLRGDCRGQPNVTNHVYSIAYYSQQEGKRTGLVTTARVTHASPGGVYAHIADRNWESDTDILTVGEDPKVCPDIASQLVLGDTGPNLNVVMGGGRSKLLPETVTDEEGQAGTRKDGTNLIEQWLTSKNNAKYVWNRNQLLNLGNDVDNVLGLFAADHMSYNLERNASQQPSLAEMTEAAIRVLSKGNNGYFLFVEGARIDMAHHQALAKLALDETAEFSKAVQTAVDLTDPSETLIVVTADHAHTMSYAGYAERGNDIFGFGGVADDKLVYTTLNYANGPGYQKNEADGSRHDISRDNYTDKSYRFPGVAPISSETHGGDDVGIYATGAWAHLFSGVIEENVIPHLLSYASCVGEGYRACDRIFWN